MDRQTDRRKDEQKEDLRKTVFFLCNQQSTLAIPTSSLNPFFHSFANQTDCLTVVRLITKKQSKVIVAKEVTKLMELTKPTEVAIYSMYAYNTQL